MVLSCLCGAKFGTIEALDKHATANGHHYKCTVAQCGCLFASLSSIRVHQKVKKHDGAIEKLNSHSGRTVDADSKSHEEFNCTKCGPNSKNFKDAASLRMHATDKHSFEESCATCGQTFQEKGNFSAQNQRLAHQKEARHCFCEEHHVAFLSLKELKDHISATPHPTAFQCLDCGREVGTQQGLNDHILACSAVERELSQEQSERAKAAFAAVEEANLRCEDCKRAFKSIIAFRQHKDSVKHKPLAHFSCNVLPSKCNQTFTSYSAWFFHIESGKCKSGMDRKKLYAMVHKGDSDNLITHQHNQCFTKSFSGAGLCSNVSVTDTRITDLDSEFDRLSISSSGGNDVIVTPDASDGASDTCSTLMAVFEPGSSDVDDSSVAGVRLTPTSSDSRSRASSTEGVLTTATASINSRSEWSYITDSHKLTPAISSASGSSTDTIMYENLQQVGKLWPCVSCSRTFRTKHRLIQHLQSPAHAPKMFHCPTPAALGLTVGKPGKEFKTLSGFAQHVEAGACDGAVVLLKNFIDICQGESKSTTNQTSKMIGRKS